MVWCARLVAGTKLVFARESGNGKDGAPYFCGRALPQAAGPSHSCRVTENCCQSGWYEVLPELLSSVKCSGRGASRKRKFVPPFLFWFSGLESPPEDLSGASGDGAWLCLTKTSVPVLLTGLARTGCVFWVCTGRPEERERMLDGGPLLVVEFDPNSSRSGKKLSFRSTGWKMWCFGCRISGTRSLLPLIVVGGLV